MPTTPVVSWPLSPETLPLKHHQIHLWWAVLSDFDSELPRFETLLSSTERARAQSFHFPKDREQYVIRHGLLRVLLGRYLRTPPSEIEFRYGPQGKPGIKSDDAPEVLYFSNSHSGHLALYAVTRACPLGVDVECLRPIPDFQDIAARFFSPRETQMLMALPMAYRTEGFFAFWTHKEAILKATGEGIAHGLTEVEMTLNERRDLEIVGMAGESQTHSEWRLRSLLPAPGYRAALAYRHPARIAGMKRLASRST